MVGNRLEVSFSEALEFLQMDRAALFQHAKAGLAFGRNGYSKLTLRFNASGFSLARCDFLDDYTPNESWADVIGAWETQGGVQLTFPFGETLKLPGNSGLSRWQTTHGGEHAIRWLVELSGTWEVFWASFLEGLSHRGQFEHLALVFDGFHKSESRNPLNLFCLLEHFERGHVPVSRFEDERLFFRVSELVIAKREIESKIAMIHSPALPVVVSEASGGHNSVSPVFSDGKIDAPELEAAIAAYRAVRHNPALLRGKKPSAALRKWLAENFPSLSEGALKRIIVVANWEKVGGAPKSPSEGVRIFV